MAGDLFASPFGAVYSAYMQRPWLSRPIGAVVWGGDIRPFYDSMAAIGELPEGGTIVDCPCGAGVALRAIEHSSLGRYIGIDLSTAMLRRARRRASALGLSDIEWLEADAALLPLAGASADLFLSYWGLHCFDDPERAVLEAARVLKPGGRLVGASFVRGPRLRQRLLVRPGRGAWGDVGTEAHLRGWLVDAQLADVRLRTSGPMAYFEARKASAGPAWSREPAEPGDRRGTGVVEVTGVDQHPRRPSDDCHRAGPRGVPGGGASTLSDTPGDNAAHTV